MSAPISPADQLAAFTLATAGFASRYGEGGFEPMNDATLAVRLEMALGLFGGRSGPDGMYISYKGAGLKIWISRGMLNPYRMTPTVQGMKTVRLARQVYGIADPDDRQLALF